MHENYIYAIATSPRSGGNTETLLDQAIKGASRAGIEVVKENLGTNPVNPCLGCNSCSRTGRCIQQDHMQDVYPHLASAAGVILAAPVFSMHLCAQAKMMIDRCQRFWALKYVFRRHLIERKEEREARSGLFLSACGRDAPDTFTCVKPTVAYFYHVLEIPAWESMEVSGVDAPGDILQRPEAMDEAERMGRSLAERVLRHR